MTSEHADAVVFVYSKYNMSDHVFQMSSSFLKSSLFCNKTGNGMMVHVEEESDVLYGMRTNQRQHIGNEDDMTYRRMG